MQKWRMQSVLGLFLLLACQPLFATPLTLHNTTSEINAGASLSWLKGSTGMTATTALNRLLHHKGHKVKHDYPSFGVVQGSRWLLVGLDNNSTQQRWILVAGRPYIDKLDVYLFNAQKTLVNHWQTGDTLPFDARPVKHPNMVFPLRLPSGRSFLLIQARSTNALDVPVKLYKPAAFFQTDIKHHLVHGLYFGAIFILCLYNLLIFLSTRDRSYLYYVLYLSCFGLFLFTREGLAFRWLWPDFPWWNNLANFVLTATTLGFSILFTASFLNLGQSNPKINRILHLAALLVFLLAIYFMVGSVPVKLSLLLVVAWPVLAIFLGIYAWIKGYQPAKYFILATLVLQIAVFFYSLKALALIPDSWLLENSMQIGTTLEAVLLSFALAHRMTIIKQENERIHQEASHRLESEVAIRTRELNEALDARSQFLTLMSHEIRTPLNGMLGTLDMLKSPNLDDKQQHYLHIIENSGNNLLQLINDILDYSRIEAGKMPLKEGAFDLTKLVREVTALFEQPAAINGNEIRTTINPNIGNQAFGDAMRIRQLLTNLISNAVKFTENGYIDIEVKRSPVNPDYVHFTVKDTGIGISEDQMSLLFNLFQQADTSTSRKYGGTGLGLAVCKQLTEIMGGEIGAESTKDKGSTFWFHLPLSRANTPELGSGKLQTAPLPTLRILIVDDNNVNLMVAEGLCNKLGHEVETCDSGSEAIATLLNDEKPFDVILMDCEMPIMDGFETTREIISLQKSHRVCQAPIVALTAHAIPDKIKACHAAGMLMHIAKPINMEKLHDSFLQILNNQ